MFPKKEKFSMASRKFRFVSPGVFLKEIDNSELPGQAPGVGPVIIGRTRQGPALKPYKVKSLEEFDRVFGAPMPGNQGDDPWRDGTDILAESYLPYAARAYLSADIDSPVTVVRLAGVAGDLAEASGDGMPGWKATKAFGLFLCTSASHAAMDATASTDLAAIFYATDAETVIGLEGKILTGSSTATTSSAVGIPVEFDSSTSRLTVNISSSSGLRQVKFLTSELRKDFNTNPVATNSRIMEPSSESQAARYWLGESFEDTISKFESTITGNAKRAAVMVELDTEMADFQSSQHGLTAARTGWVIANNATNILESFNPAAQQKLFRLVALQEGFGASKDLMVSVEDIVIPREGATNKYGSFSIVVKRIFSDKIEDIERFDNCNLNPDSNNYVARMIGDQYQEWSKEGRRNKLLGSHPNMSEYIRVEMDRMFNTAPTPENQEAVPFGFLGPVIPKTLSTTVSAGSASLGGIAGTWTKNDTYGAMHFSASNNVQASWPEFPLVATGSDTDGFQMGATCFKRTFVSGAATTTSKIINEGYSDHVRRLPSLDNGVFVTDQDDGVADGASCEHAFKFTLDDVVLVPSPSVASTASINNEEDVVSVYYEAGSYVGGNSFSYHIASGSGSAAARRPLCNIVRGFNMPLVGGTDGTNIVEANPFNNNILTDKNDRNHYAYASIDRAIQLIKNPELIEHNLALMPGITNESLTTELVRVCESRGDSLAIIDLPSVYVPPSENKCTTFANRLQTTPEASAKALVKRQINSSYGATYYPWCKVRDTQNSRDVWVPPSVVALGVMAYTEKRDEVWFAPAGFNRGGLNQGNAGIPVLQVSEQLLSKDRDTLYEANINPIASFVSEGLVVFGQKTLQTTQSALDRINVRRLLIFIKKRVSIICNELLFEQNVRETWNRFINAVVPELQEIKTRFGLSDFKVVLDDTTTTPDLVDRNIMYAKIFLKPARSIEFIAVDFVITNTGAGFND